MKASEARSLAIRNNNGRLQKELESIHIAINTEIKKGKFHCDYYKSISKDAIDDLNINGYVIEKSYDGRDQQYWYTIKW